MAEIIVAKTAGFCFGVDRAVKEVERQLALGKRVATLGEIIHNPHVVRRFEEKGVRVLDRVEDNTDRRTVVIRSHGVPRSVYDRLAELGMDYVDATCPYVAKIHEIVSRYGEDTTLLIAGDETHPEIVGITGHCKTRYYVFRTAQDLEKLLSLHRETSQNHCVMLAQTTFNTSEWTKSVNLAKKVCTNLLIFDTICKATVNRQTEAAHLAQTCDLVIVVGGRHSSNTAKLYEITNQLGSAILVESAAELGGYSFHGVQKVGITAGASTPAFIIKEVQTTMSEILSTNAKNEDEMSFEEMLEQSFKTTYTREKVTGVVTGIKPNEISVDIGTKHAGYVPLSELTDDPNAKAEDLVQVGDQLDLIVMRVNDVEGTMMLSKKRLDAIAGFEKVMNAVDTGEVLEGTVVEVIKGGVLVLTNGVRVFIPASLATMYRSDDLNDLLKKTVRFKILEVNKQRRRAVGSIRAVLRDEKKAAEDKFWENVEVGQKYTGKVKSLTSYGAFVDLGGVDGRIHITELNWSRIKHPSEVVKVGDELNVFIRDIDPEKKRISLGYKTEEQNPWNILAKTYQVGDTATVQIVSLTPFGAFAQLMPGIDGLIHISQIARERINKPSDVLSVGQEVKVKITEIDYDKKRISLSIRALLEEGDEEAAAAIASKEEEAAPAEAEAPAAEEAPAETAAE